MTPQIQTVLVDQIDPHPSNPRRVVDGLTELAASIRAHGIQQNLLLVPYCTGCPDSEGLRVKDDGTSWCTIHKREGRLRVVIGHRRLAAARQAGLVEVPAVIDPHLTATEQVELMLLENVQRRDLSPVEEAEGYQQLLDLDVPVTMIAKRTGRAASTVRGRLALLTLDEGAREKVHAGQATLEDAATLVELAGHPDAAWLAEMLGTPNFDWQAKRIRDDIKRDGQLRKLADKLTAKGLTETDASDTDGLKFLESLQPQNALPKDLGGAETFALTHFSVNLYRALTQEELDRADKSAAAKERRDKRNAAAAEAAAVLDAERVAVWELRDAFVRGLLTRTPSAAQRQLILTGLIPWMSTEGRSPWGLAEWFGLKGYGDELRDTLTDTQWVQTPEWLIIAWAHTQVGAMRYTWPKAMTRETTRLLYSVLEELGYTLSDAERARLYPQDAS